MRLQVLLVLACLFSSAHPGEKPVMDKPVGLNCSLADAPIDAGEEFGHGALLRVFPRMGQIDRTYNGCQVVFISTAQHPTRLAWLVEVRMGEPVRLWSEAPELRDRRACFYKRAKLVNSDLDSCPAQAPELLPSMPAGCAAQRTESNCEYDSQRRIATPSSLRPTARLIPNVRHQEIGRAHV